MQRVRLFVYCLITIFIVDVAYANAAMIVIPHQEQTESSAGTPHCHDMQMGMTAEAEVAMTHDLDSHSHDQSKSASGTSCDTCHDCLACFSMLPTTEVFPIPVYPVSVVLQPFVIIYHSPHLVALQRPPIFA